MRCTAIALFVWLSVSSPAAQSRDYPTWLEAVETHVPGERDDAAQRLAAWSLDELDEAAAGLTRPPLRNDLARVLERALVLHADIAILHRGVRGYDLPDGPIATRLIDDGREIGRMSGTAHWDAARRLVERAPAGADRARVARQFYRATAAVLQQWGELPELTVHLQTARRLLGEDAVLLLYEGTMHQAYAGARYQRVFDERVRAAFPRGGAMRMADGRLPTTKDLPPVLPSVRGSRAQAERLFRRALAIDPTLVEARVRLAHVLSDAGRHRQAEAELKPIGTDPLPDFLDYYAALVTGRVARALGRIDAAGAAFERAAGVYPDAPAPRLALSEIALTRGDHAASLARLYEAAPPSRTGADEPWWWLDRVHEPSAGALMAAMRRATPP